MKPNIVFLLIDSLRADKTHGEDKTSVTPNIDQMIENGVYFKNNISVADGTVFVLSSLFTGLYPFKTGVTKGGYNNLDSSIDTYFSILSKNGYHAYGCVPEIVNTMGFLKEFEKDFSHTYDGFLNLSEGLGDTILEQLNSNSMLEPWIYFIHINDIHFPIIPPKEFDDASFGSSKYERMVSSIDSWLGKFLEKINLENTLVIMTADHGQYIPNVKSIKNNVALEPDGALQRTTTKLGNKIPNTFQPLKKKLFFMIEKIRKEIKEKKIQNLNLRPYEKRALLAQRSDIEHYLFDEKIHVPLLFFGFGINHSKIITQQVRSFDIFPTISEMLSFSNPKIIDGQSLLPLFTEKHVDELPIFLETSPLIQIKSNDTLGIRTSHYKYFRHKNNKNKLAHLYDLTVDPFEENNIIDKHPEIVEEMEQTINDILSSTNKSKIS
jgi:arylsulfatase A-like enzyme